MTVATRMYTDEGFKVDETFRKISKKTLDTGTVQVNFTDGVKTAEVINSWARSETKGKIKELFSPGQCRPHRDTEFVPFEMKNLPLTHLNVDPF